MMKTTKMISTLSPVVLALSLCGLVSPARADAPASKLAFSNLAVSSSNASIDAVWGLGGESSQPASVLNGTAQNWINHPVVTVNYSTVITPATTTEVGLAYDFSKATGGYAIEYKNYTYEAASGAIGTVPAAFSGQKYVALTGTITSLMDMQLGLNLYANGHYETTSFMGIPVAPGSASIYWGSSLSDLTVLGASTYTSAPDGTGPGSYSTSVAESQWASGAVSGGVRMSLNAGVAQTFALLAFAQDGVSIDTFSYAFRSGGYDYGAIRLEDHPTSTINMLGAHIIPVVPEPETYAMLLAGLGLLGFVARRKNQKPA